MAALTELLIWVALVGVVLTVAAFIADNLPRH